MAVTIQKACIYLALILLIMILIYIKSKMDVVEEKEGFESGDMGYLYGPNIGPSGNATIPVQDVKTLSNGVKVYMIEDSGFVKMVSDKGEARYFTGTINQFDPNKWSSYNSVGDGYKYKPPAVTASTTDPVSGLIQLKNPNKNNLCLDDAGATTPGAVQMQLWTCDPNNKNQQFIYDPKLKQLKNPNKNNLCVDDGGGTKAGQSKMWMFTCDPNNINQQFVYNSDTKMFVNPNKNLCIDDGGATDSSGKIKAGVWDCDPNNVNQIFKSIPIGGSPAKRTLTFNKDGLVSTGLKCYLDATRKESYNPGFGNVWKDISGAGRNFTWNKAPLFFNGKISTAGNTALGPNGDSFELGDGSNGFTIVIFSKTNKPAQSNAILVENSNNVYGLNVHLPWIDNTVYFDQGWNSGSKNGAQNRIQNNAGPCDTFFVWMFVRDYDGSMKIYRNGVVLASNAPNSADNLTLKSVPWKMSVGWDADISKFMVYNTYMTQDDVTNITNWILADDAKQRDIRMAANVDKAPEKLPVKLGLQLYLDTSNYTPGSKDWLDQSGNGYDFTWNSPPKVDNMSFLLNGEYALSNKTGKELNIDGFDTYTIAWTAKTNSLGYNNVFNLKGYHTNNRAIFCHPTWIDGNIYFDNAGVQRITFNVNNYYKDFAFYTLRKTKDERAIFINGKKVASDKGAGPLNVTLDKMIIAHDLDNNYTWFANLRKFMVYNRDLSDGEILRLYTGATGGYDFKNLDYKGSSQYCKSKGQKLCSASDYCTSGKPAYTIDEVQKWGPVADYPDGWIQLGKSGDVCKTEKQQNVADREVAILCCDNKIEPLVINAIYIDGTSKTYFKGKYYQTITPNSVSRVMDISKFPGLTSNFKSGSIDAIAIGNLPNVSIWLKRSHLMIYDSTKKEGAEMEIRDFFHGLPDDFSSGFIDAVATRGANTEYIMFKKNRYCIVDMKTLTFLSAGTISDKYTSMPRDFQLGYFDSAVYSKPDCSYIMKNDKLIEYNFSNNSVVLGPVEILSNKNFNTLLPPFIPKNSACVVYQKLMRRFPKEKHWEMMYYNSCKRISKKEYEMNLENYHKIVKRYEEKHNKETSDSKKMALEISKYEKLLTDKKKELKEYRGKLFELKNMPCPPEEKCPELPKCKSKQIVVYDQGDVNAQQFYQVDKDVLKSCMKY